MKKLILLTVLLFGLIIQKSNGQSSSMSNTYNASNYLGWSTTHNIPFYMGSNFAMDLTTAGNLNVRNSSNGYEIDSNLVLWHAGDVTSIYVGIGAGFTYPGPVGDPFNNTFVGYKAGMAFNNTNGVNFNTAVGGEALQNNISFDNTASGYQSQLNVTTGNTNTSYGVLSLFENQHANYNVAMGPYTLFHDTASNNTACGYAALFNNTKGYSNTSLGWNSGLVNVTGSYDLLLGGGADASANNLKYATAIGARAITSASYQMELGNDSVTVTIGSSAIAPTTPVTKLEIRTDGTTPTAPFNISYNTTAPHNVNTGRGTGWSGLRFDDLTALSMPGKNPGPGYLSVDSFGNVIYVDTALASGGAGTGIGYCGGSCGSGTGLTAMTWSGGYNLNSNNFYFAGNNAGTIVNNVAIGNGCCYVPAGKLDVLQTSGSTTGSIGIYVQNNDAPTTNLPAVIGIKSYMPANTISCTPPYERTVAGWFEAEGAGCFTTAGYIENYAIFVPGTGTFSPTGAGGGVAIGYPFASQPSIYTTVLLNVNSAIQALANYYPSDTTIKMHVTYFNSGIKVIRQLKPVSYKYNGLGGFDTLGTYIGLIAQNLERAHATYAVRPETIVKDTTTHDTANILSIDNSAVMYTAINAIKEVDSVNTVQQNTIDSLRNELDSLRSAFKSYITCLNSLCGGTSGAVAPQNGGNGNLKNNTASALTIQDVTLSSSTGAPLLYQNIPNPFSTGTKINYYLPEGTIGASIMFFDTYGNQIKTVQLNQTGNGTLNVASDNLTNGIYSYSLMVNGAVIDTKRMVLQK